MQYGRALVWWVCLGLVCMPSRAAQAAGDKAPRKSPPSAARPVARPDSLASSAVPDSTDSTTTTTSPGSGRTARSKFKPAAPTIDVVRFRQSFHVHEDEEVQGDVVLVDGDLKVDGWIRGGAVVLSGNIEIGPRAQIGGEAIAVGGRVDAAPGANVRGGTVTLNFGGPDWQNHPRLGILLGNLLQVILWIVLGALFVGLGKAKLRRTMATIAQSPGRCIGLGILALTGGLFSVVMLVVLLALTLVGLPLALLLALATLVFLAAAQVAGLTRLGSALAGGLRWRTPSLFAATVLGIITVMLPKVGAELLRLGEPTRAVVLLQILHAVMIVILLAAGVGALVVSRIGVRRPQAPPWRVAAPASLQGSSPPAAPAPSAD